MFRGRYYNTDPKSRTGKKKLLGNVFITNYQVLHFIHKYGFTIDPKFASDLDIWGLCHNFWQVFARPINAHKASRGVLGGGLTT